MTEKEARERFLSEYVTPLSEKYFNVFLEEIEQNYDVFISEIVVIFDDFLKKLLNSEKEISIIAVSVLRSSLKENNSYFYFSAYDKNFYVDKDSINIGYEINFLFKQLINLSNQLHIDKKKFVQKVSKDDVDKVKQIEVSKYLEIAILLFRRAIPFIEKLESFINIKKDDNFEIRVGEYLDKTEKIYINTKSTKNSEILKKEFEKIYNDYYNFKHFHDINLSNGIYNGINLNYSLFENIDFCGSQIENSSLVDTKFIDCNLNNSSFKNATFLGTTFDNCKMKNVNFTNFNINVQFNVEEMKVNLFPTIYFKNCTIKNCDFTGANLTMVKFINCTFLDTSFENTTKFNTDFDAENFEIQILNDGIIKVIEISKYHEIQQDEYIVNTPILTNFKATKFDKKPITEDDIFITIRGEKENSEISYTDFILNPTLLVSDKFKKVVSMYNKKLECRPVVLNHRKTDSQNLYWYIVAKEYDCLSSKSKKGFDGLYNKLVIDKEKVEESSFFLTPNKARKVYVIRLDLLESLFRRNLYGFIPTPLEND